MNRSEWIRLIEKLQARAFSERRVNPLDVLLLLNKGLNTNKDSGNLQISIHTFMQKIRKWMARRISNDVSEGGKPILFFPTEPTHVAQMIPVVRALSLQGGEYLFVTTKVPLFNMLRSQAYRVVLVSEARKGNNLLISIDQVNVVLLEAGRPEIISIVKRYYGVMDKLARSIAQVFQRIVPSYVVIGNDLTWECRLVARICELQGVRTGMIQHGLLGHEIYNRFHVVNDIFVYGSAFKAILELDGLRNTNVVVTGAPYLDSMPFEIGSEPNLSIKRRFGLKGNYVLIAFSGAGDRTTVENYEAILKWIKRLIDEHRELDFVIKLHRKERLDAYSEFSSSQHARIVDRNRAKGLPTDIFEWFAGCDCLVTGTSTLAYEAMLCKIPIISLDPLKQYDGINFIEEKAVQVVTTYEDLVDGLMRTLGKRVGYHSFIGKIFAGTDGKSANRILDEIRRVSALDEE